MTVQDGLQAMKLQDLKSKTPTDLLAFAEELEIENASSMRKQDMLFAILKELAERNVEITGTGVVETLPDESRGWLAGLKDGHVGRALNLMHTRPNHDWTLDGLSREVGLSRSSFAERFAGMVGIPPMQYLQRWRLQAAASRLSQGAASIAVIAAEAGYESEAAFSRAFKKAVGTPPAEWRKSKCV